jgi:hypothetical protein
MSFSRAQQRIYGALVHKAWLLHCERHGIETGPGKNRDEYAAAHDAWYERQLRDGLGVETTAVLNHRRDFERASAHFERVAALEYAPPREIEQR